MTDDLIPNPIPLDVRDAIRRYGIACGEQDFKGVHAAWEDALTILRRYFTEFHDERNRWQIRLAERETAHLPDRP